ncbi:MAG: hypothetical protein ACFN27_00285 [Prevotella sp.]
MMKKLLLSFVMLATVATVYATDFKYQWHHTIYGKTNAGNTPVSVIKTTDGNYVTLSSFGSNTLTGIKVYFDDQPLKDTEGKDIEGCPYVGNNANAVNHNLLLQKYNQQTGEVLWTVYSDKGYLYNNQAIYPTSDGGLIMVSDVRNLANKTETTLIRMVGADNQKTEVSYTPAGNNQTTAEGVIAKIDKDGKVKWAKLIATTTHPTIGGKNYGGYAIYYKGLVVDGKGNIYVCGNYMSAVTFVKSDGSQETHQAKNTEAWDGTVQSSAGDPFIAKLDKDGYLLQFMTEDESGVKFATFDKMVIKDDVLYVSGRLKGDGTATIKFGDTTLQPNDCLNLLYASVKTENLSLNYIKMFVAGRIEKSCAVQNMNLQYYNGSLYMTGLITGSLADDAASAPFIATKTKMREAMIVKVDAKDGKRLAAGIDGQSITSAYAVIETNDPSTVWVYGYHLFGKARLNKYTLKEDKLVKGTEEIALEQAFMGMLGTPLIDGTSFVSMARPRYNSGTILGATGPATTFFNWGIVLTKYTCDDILPDGSTPTGIRDVSVQKEKIPNHDVYTLTGVLIKRAKSMEEAINGLSSGLYIIGGKKIVVK